MIDTKLYSLLAVYENKSFVKASEKLSITQPAVSQHISALENELGIKIFERTRGGITTTKDGEKVIRCVKKMIGLENVLKQELNDEVTSIDHFTIGITHTAESNQVAEAIARFATSNTKVSIKMVTESVDKLYDMLKTYEIDIAVIEGKTNRNRIKYLNLDTDTLVLAVSPNHKFAKKDEILLSEIKKEPLILRLPNSSTRNLFVAHLESKGMSIKDFNVILEVDNVATIKDLIRRDIGISVLPKSALLDELKKGKIIALNVKGLEMNREINIAYLDDFTHINMLNDIVKTYHEVLKTYK